MSPPYIEGLRRARRSSGLTQAELAKLLGLKSRSHISLLERGERVPTVAHFLILEAVFQIPGHTLFPRIHKEMKMQVGATCDSLFRELKADSSKRAEQVTKLLQTALVNVTLEDVIIPN